MSAIKFHEYQPGNEDFRHYIDRLGYCFIANNIISDQAKKANIYTVCGSQVYETALALITPRKSQDVTYEQLVVLLTNHYTPKVNEITMTYRFYNGNQLKEEKANDYITQLRKLGACCNFDNLECNLRDCLVCGIKDEKLQFELLKRDNLTYAQVVHAMILAETALQDVSLMRMNAASNPNITLHASTTASTVEPMDIGAVKDNTPSYKYRSCYRCGNKHSGVCRYINAICNYCHKKGHLEKICTQKCNNVNRKVN